MRGHIDGYGRKEDRKGVALIQRLQGSAERKEKAQAKRDRRNAKRSSEDRVILLAAPPGGVSSKVGDGVYIAIGHGIEAGAFQIIVVGPRRFTDEQYRDAAAAWAADKLIIIESGPLPPEERLDDDLKARIHARGFWSIILKYEPTEV